MDRNSSHKSRIIIDPSYAKEDDSTKSSCKNSLLTLRLSNPIRFDARRNVNLWQLRTGVDLFGISSVAIKYNLLF